MSQTISIESFIDIYVAPSFKDNYEYSLLKCFAEMCSGWKQETFKNIINLMTKKNTSPVPLFFNSPLEMAILSNKNLQVKELYNHLNYRKSDNRKLDRIDTFELISVILLSIDGSFESLIKNVICIFGFEDYDA